jgi:hypothetical protein
MALKIVAAAAVLSGYRVRSRNSEDQNSQNSDQIATTAIVTVHCVDGAEERGVEGLELGLVVVTVVEWWLSAGSFPSCTGCSEGRCGPSSECDRETVRLVRSVELALPGSVRPVGVSVGSRE